MLDNQLCVIRAFTSRTKQEKEIAQIVMDPNLETADINRNNNYWPERKEPTRFELFKARETNTEPNPMQKVKGN